MAGTLYGWKDRAFESIPLDQPMTRAVWLTGQMNDRERKAGVPYSKRTPATAQADQAWRQVCAETFSLTPAHAAPGAGPD